MFLFRSMERSVGSADEGEAKLRAIWPKLSGEGRSALIEAARALTLQEMCRSGQEPSCRGPTGADKSE